MTRARCGDRRAYRNGCRCLQCRAANAAYVQSRRAGQLYPDPMELVDARPAELHLLTLRGQGVGYRQAAKLAGLDESLVVKIRTGRKTQIRADTLSRILGIPAVLAHGQTVTGWRTQRLLSSLEGEGFQKGRIARMLGNRQAKLPLRQKQRIRVRSALKVRVLWNRVNDGPAGEARFVR